MNDRIVTVFGGSGFLGRRVVRHLCKHGFSVRIASRHPVASFASGGRWRGECLAFRHPSGLANRHPAPAWHAPDPLQQPACDGEDHHAR
ncbi:NmrA family NAD(P)-binding protein [Mesorhizobium temperatum]|uniref:Uncharacterized protein n=1 Tax=Mesorhizobium temperatum TaxID=241416 RepID=A0A271LYM9_9HYPH|nr:hypothetical protein CIT26_01525 [Mesorhizobium temperatum]